jgi:hypothetical protein
MNIRMNWCFVYKVLIKIRTPVKKRNWNFLKEHKKYMEKQRYFYQVVGDSESFIMVFLKRYMRLECSQKSYKGLPLGPLLLLRYVAITIKTSTSISSLTQPQQIWLNWNRIVNKASKLYFQIYLTQNQFFVPKQSDKILKSYSGIKLSKIFTT